MLGNPAFASAAMRHRVAAATEHLPAIKLTQAKSLIDIGANKGQFSLAFRGSFPMARIDAFEPLPEAGDTYAAVFAGDENTHLHRNAIADFEGELKFYVTDRADSSSLLVPGVGQREAFGVSEARTIMVPVQRLTSCVDLLSLQRPILMKIDVQGAELQVVRSVANLDVEFIYCELSFVDLYDGQATVIEFFDHLAAHGFALVGVFNQVNTDRFGPTQADFLFKRR